MRLKRIWGLLMAGILTGGLVGVSSPAKATVTNLTQGIQVTDRSGDAISDGSAECLYDDNDPADPEAQSAVPSTPLDDVSLGQAGTPGACDKSLPELDMTMLSLQWKDNLLEDPAGTDHVYGTADDLIGPDRLSGTADDVKPAIKPMTSGLEAKWTVNGAWPLPGDTNRLNKGNNFTLDDLTARVIFRNPDKHKNQLFALCERDTSTSARKTYLYNYGGHYEDNFFDFINFEMTWTPATGYLPKVQFGYFEPGTDGFFITHDPYTNKLYNPYGPSGSGEGRFYNWILSADRKTLTSQVPAIYTTLNGTCMGPGGITDTSAGYAAWPMARTAAQKAAAANYYPGNGQNDQISHVSGFTTWGTTPRTPFPIPTGQIPIVSGEVGLDDIDWVIGLGTFVDHLNYQGVSQYTSGIGESVLMTGDWYGPACPAPTFGGTVPENPLYTAGKGQPCALDNPIGPEWGLTGLNFQI